MEKLQEHNFIISYITGRENIIADTLLQFPATKATANTGELDETQNLYECCFHEQVCLVRSYVDEPDPQLQELIVAAEGNKEYRHLINCLKTYKHFKGIPKE